MVLAQFISLKLSYCSARVLIPSIVACLLSRVVGLDVFVPMEVVDNVIPSHGVVLETHDGRVVLVTSHGNQFIGHMVGQRINRPIGIPIRRLIHGQLNCHMIHQRMHQLVG